MLPGLCNKYIQSTFIQTKLDILFPDQAALVEPAQQLACIPFHFLVNATLNIPVVWKREET